MKPCGSRGACPLEGEAGTEPGGSKPKRETGIKKKIKEPDRMKISYENKCLVIAWCRVPRHGQQNELESPPGSELNATLPDFLRGDAQCWRLGCAGTMLEAEIIDGL